MSVLWVAILISHHGYCEDHFYAEIVNYLTEKQIYRLANKTIVDKNAFFQY